MVYNNLLYCSKHSKNHTEYCQKSKNNVSEIHDIPNDCDNIRMVSKKKLKEPKTIIDLTKFLGNNPDKFHSL